MSLNLPTDKSEARRVVFETLRVVRDKLSLPRGSFDHLATEIMHKLYPPKVKPNRATRTR
jgi:hypothetical protein